MAKTLSTMLPLETPAPNFLLPDTTTRALVSLSTYKLDAAATVIVFMCNHCPYVKHILEGLVTLSNDYTPKNIAFIAINSNDITHYPDDAPEKMAKLANEYDFNFPYLFDETQEVAKAYHAACTPDFYIFDKNRVLVYRGQMDDSRPGNNIPVTGEHLRKTLDAIIANAPITVEQKPSIGCNIKWK